MKLIFAILFVAAASRGSILKAKEKLTFKTTASRSTEESPSIQVTFANGFQDDLELAHYRMNEESVVGCNYLGHLRNSPSSSVAVTGCLNKPGDKMEVTLISENNINKMFSVDFYGNAEVIKNPFEEGALSRALPIDREEWHQNGDEELNDAEEESVATAAVTSIPSTLKAVIKFGYETGLKNALGSEDFDAWIAGVFTHTQAHFRHAASLGTTIEFEVQGSALYKDGTTWTADDNIYDARDATNAAGLSGVDTMSWWCNAGGGGTAGIAFVGALCSSYNTNLNEKQWSVAGSGFVLAHELGHNFGMSHDFDDKHGGSSGACNGQGIMSYGSYDYNQWSTCSKSDWEEHYSGRNWGNGCLEDISDSTGPTEGPTEAPGPDVCFDVKTVTKAWGNEIEWTIGCSGGCNECGSDIGYGNNQEYTQQCCMPKDEAEFLITCKDSYGDGWHGGYLEINGESYCEEFSSGTELVDTLLNEQTTPGIVCTNIKIVTKRWGNENSWTFGSCAGPVGNAAGSAEEYGNRQVYTEECCQEAGDYELVCKDSYGDGWHTGYLEIGGTKYCDTFDSGHEQTYEVSMAGEGNTPATEGPTQAPPPTDCGVAPAGIVGGSEVTPYSLPWQVGLVSPGQDRTWCGATLIGPQHVLTAAHCMGYDFEVVVGEHQINSAEDGTRHQVCGTTLHPSWNDGTLDYDFAIVRLTEPVQLGARAVPACLADASMAGDALDGQTVTVSGWGTTAAGGNQAEVLMSVDVPAMTNAACRETGYGENQITDAMLCAGQAAGGIDSCQGDSGGPLTYTTGGKTYLVGVVSWGIGCATANFPGVYARVSHVRDWIDQQMAITC